VKINQVQERIQELFGIFVTEMKAAKALNRTGINHVYERILIPLFSLCYGFENLKNLNSTEYFNYPGVDLGDSVARVAIQVTATRDSRKVKQTLTKFREKELFSQYDRLIIYILSEKQSSYSGKGFDEIIQGKFAFDKDRDIIDFSDLLKIIKDFQIDKAKHVLQILETNITGTELRAPTIPQHEYEDVGGYLERTVCETKDAGPYSAYLLREEQMFDLATIVQREKRVVLLCDAGVGKSTELKRIAAVYSKPDSPFHIDLISLNKYVNHSIEQMLCPEWSNQLGNHSLVILDGFDEIESQNRNNAVRQIELFVELHPTVNVVVSCRTNFYNRESEGFSGTLRHFSSYTLLPLTDAAISQYIGNRLGTRGRLFMQRITNGQLYDLLYSPFYLTRLVELFLQTGDLPQQKADIFEQLIKHSLTLDTEKFRATESLINKQAEIIETIERLALSMEMLGRNFLKDNEYREIIRESATRELAQYCALWKKEEKEEVSWQFDQNSFQEYLAARVLARHPLPTIKSFVSFEPEYPKVIPSWTNTLSFLVSILKPGDPKLTGLIEWLEEIEPEVIIKFESDKIPEAVRVSYLKSIIEDHKRKEIVFDYEKFSYHELARFGQSDEAIRYLIEEANSSANVAMLVNILNLLRFMSLPHNQRQAAGSLFETLVTNRDLDGHVRYLASVALADHGFTSDEVIDRIVAANRDSTDDEVKHGLFYLLVNSKYLEDNIDVLLDGIQYANGMGGTVGHSTILGQGLDSVRTQEAMKLIFAHMKAHPNLWTRSFLDDHIPIIIKNAAALHSSDHTIRADVLEIVFTWTRNYHRRQADMVAAFFDITGTRFETFLAVYEGRGRFPNQHHDWFELLALLAQEQGLQFFAAEYTAGRLTEQDVWGFQNSLGFVRGAELYAVFNSLINEVSGNQFVLPPARNYEAEQREMSHRNFNLLFDKVAFLSEVNHVFAEELATELTTQQIEKIFSDGLQDGHKYSTLAVQELREIAISNRGTVSQQLVLECVSNAWEHVSIDKIYRYMEHDDKIELTAEQHTRIVAWCNANLRNVDFRSAIVVNPDGSWNTNAIGTKLWFFQRRLGLDYPEDLMLDMLSYEIFDQSGLSGIEYFEDQVDSVLMTGRILDNLAAGIRSPYVLKNHLNYCKRHKVQEVIPHALREIVTPLSDSFGRHNALETVISFPNAVENLETVLPQINDGFKWSVIEYLNNHDSAVALEALRTILAGENDSERLRAAIALIERNSLDGLAYYVDQVERTKQYPAGPMEKSPLRNLQSSEAVPFVMRLLKVSLDPDIIGRDQFSFLYNVALSALTKIALSSRDSFLLVREAFTVFMRENHDLKGIRNLHFQLSRLERTYFTSVAQRLTLKEVSTRVDAIFDPSNRAQRSRA
jgi:hypothetical protein